jgi:adenosylhomocysteine nucleosidase
MKEKIFKKPTVVLLICTLWVTCFFSSCGTGNKAGTARTGIIGAMDEEVNSLKDAMTDKKITTVAGMEFCEGKLDEKDVIVVKCGMGKVNAGICAQILVDHYDVGRVINTGVAGSLDAQIDIGDVVISTETVQHDFDLTPIGYQRGELDSPRMIAIPADEEMRATAVEAVKEVASDIQAFEGRICSGDQFVASKEQKESIVSDFQGMCCEMEGGAIAQVCYLNNVPFVIIRAISDKADDSEEVSYETFKEGAAEHCAAVARYVVRKMG